MIEKLNKMRHTSDIKAIELGDCLLYAITEGSGLEHLDNCPFVVVHFSVDTWVRYDVETAEIAVDTATKLNNGEVLDDTFDKEHYFDGCCVNTLDC